MSTNETLNDSDRWLAAEYALGVLSGKEMKKAESRTNQDSEFRDCVEGWQEQLSPMLDAVDEVPPSAMVWNSIDKRLFEPAVQSPQTGVASNGSGFWKLMTALTSTAAVASFAMLMFITDGDFTGRQIQETQLELAAVKSESAEYQLALETAQAELDGAATRLADLERQADGSLAEIEQVQQELTATREALESANSEVAAIRQQVSEARPLVASLTQSGDAPAFVAQYDPLKKALLIRTAVADEDEKVPEVWLIPAQGDREGEVLSLGVMDEAAPDTLPISEDFLSLIGEGGTLAITMEPVGGAPNGVATGPVIALGKLQAF